MISKIKIEILKTLNSAKKQKKTLDMDGMMGEMVLRGICLKCGKENCNKHG